MLALLAVILGLTQAVGSHRQPAWAGTGPDGEFQPLWQTPVIDTRYGTNVPQAKIPANGSLTFQAPGKAGIPEWGVKAVSFTISVYNTTAFGWMSIGPTDEGDTGVSTVTYTSGEASTGSDYTRVTTGRQTTVWNHSNSAVDVAISTNGYFQNTTATGPITSRNGGRCIDVAGGSNANGTAIQLYDCNNSNAQKIALPGDGTLRVLGKCLDLTAGATANGTKVQLYDCNSSPAQQWVPHADGTVVNPGSGRCFDAAANGTANGTLIQIWDCNEGPGQYWNLPGEPAAKTGYQPVPTSVLYDSRDGTGSPARTTPIPANGSLTIDVLGRNGLPANAGDAGAVALNVVALQHTANGNLGIHPSDAPESSPILNFIAGEQNSAFTVAQLSGTGQLTIENNSSGTVHVSISVRGYFAWNGADTEGKFHSVRLHKLLKTMEGQGVYGGSTAAIPAWGSITFDALDVDPVEGHYILALTLQIAAQQPQANGWLSIYPEGSSDPNISSVSFQANEPSVSMDNVIPNTLGEVTITNHSAGTVHLEVSTPGYFITVDPANVVPVEPGGPAHQPPGNTGFPEVDDVIFHTVEDEDIELALSLTDAVANGLPARLATVNRQKPKCKTRTKKLTAKSWTGITIWTYSLQVRWCWRNSKVTMLGGIIDNGDVTTKGSLGGWSYEGYAGNPSQIDWFGDKWAFVSRQEGRFQQCLIKIGGCIDTMTPEIRITTYGDGRSYAWGSLQ